MPVGARAGEAGRRPGSGPSRRGGPPLDAARAGAGAPGPGNDASQSDGRCGHRASGPHVGAGVSRPRRRAARRGECAGGAEARRRQRHGGDHLRQSGAVFARRPHGPLRGGVDRGQGGAGGGRRAGSQSVGGRARSGPPAARWDPRRPRVPDGRMSAAESRLLRLGVPGAAARHAQAGGHAGRLHRRRTPPCQSGAGLAHRSSGPRGSPPSARGTRRCAGGGRHRHRR